MYLTNYSESSINADNSDVKQLGKTQKIYQQKKITGKFYVILLPKKSSGEMVFYQTLTTISGATSELSNFQVFIN